MAREGWQRLRFGKGSMESRGRTRCLQALGLIAAIAGGVFVSRYWDLSVTLHFQRSRTGGVQYGTLPTETSRQLVLEYYGSSSCMWCRMEELQADVRVIQDSLRVRAERAGWSFKAKGIALDQSPRAGVQHLWDVGGFDEVSAGYQWANDTAVRHLWSKGLAASTPTLILVERKLHIPDRTAGVAGYQTTDRRRVAVKQGVRDIGAWVEQGIPGPARFLTPESRASDKEQ